MPSTFSHESGRHMGSEVKREAEIDVTPGAIQQILFKSRFSLLMILREENNKEETRKKEANGLCLEVTFMLQMKRHRLGDVRVFKVSFVAHTGYKKSMQYEIVRCVTYSVRTAYHIGKGKRQYT